MRKRIIQKENETVVKLIDGKKAYIGRAKVHPEDVDLANHDTGAIIAEARARVKRHNAKAKEHNDSINKLLKQIKVLEEARDYHLEEANDMNEFVQAYINRKDQFYTMIRKNRENPRGLDEIIESITKRLLEMEEEQND